MFTIYRQWGSLNFSGYANDSLGLEWDHATNCLKARLLLYVPQKMVLQKEVMRKNYEFMK